MATELKNDIVELEKIRQSAIRPNVQNLLDNCLKDWRQKLDTLNVNSNSSNCTVTVNTNGANSVRPFKKLTTYAFDESDKFVKLYYSITNIANLPNDRVNSKFTENSFHVTCFDVHGTDYELSAVGLLHEIDPLKSVVKIKSDSLLVMMKKKSEGVTWNSLLKLEKSQEEAKLPKLDSSGDPQDSLMNMMKQMYDSGDDEMKRTIRKAWHESQSKKSEFSPDL